jgi:LysM repeat protein
MCPYLAAVDGAWRSSTVAREHRCGAVTPPAQLAAEKQRRLCLTADHRSCATYEAARAARPLAQGPATTLPRPLARTTPLILDHGRIAVAMPALRSDRPNSQAILIALLAIAFVAILFARLTGGSGLAVATLGSPTPRATTVTGTAGPTAASTVEPSAAPAASAAPSGAPATPRPSPSSGRTYKVKSGDTLIGIAAKYGTTPKAIAKLNGIPVSANLHIGQILKIP